MARTPVEPDPRRRGRSRWDGPQRPDPRRARVGDSEPILLDTAKQPAPRPARRSVLWRYRWQLTPIAVAAGAWLLAILMRAWPPAGVVLVAAAVATLVGLHRFRLRGEELLYGRLVVAAGSSWIIAAALIGPARPGVALAWAILTIGAGLPWWRHRRIRGRIRVDRTIEAWPDWSNRAGLTGVRIVTATAGRVSDRLRLELRRGQQNARQLVDGLENLASVRGTPVWRLRADTTITRTDPGLVDLLITHTDPWRADNGDAIAVPHPTIADPAGWAGTVRSICDPVPYGIGDDGTPAELRLRTKAGGRVIAIVAMKGAGKTGILRDVFAGAVTMEDADIAVIDHKERGKASAPWAAALYARATTPQAAVALLSRLIEDNAQRGADSPDAVLQPTPQRRALLLIVDEYGALVAADPRIGDLVETYARTSRSASGALVIADQHVDSVAWSGALRGQLDEVLVGRLQSRRAVRQILPGSLDIDPSEFDEDMHGLVVQRAGKAGTALLRRAWHLEEATDVAALLQHVAARPTATYADTLDLDLQPRTPDPAETRTGRGAELRAGIGDVLDQVAAAATAPRGADLTIAQLRARATTPDAGTPDEQVIDQRIITEIRGSASGGVSMGDLVDRIGVARSTLQMRCALLRRQGTLHTDPPRGRHARWHLTDSHASSSPNA